MNITLWAVFLFINCVKSEYLREGDNFSMECGDSDWKYCKWKHETFSCDRGGSSHVTWCDRAQGLRWSQGEVCGLDVVGIMPEHAGNWTATIVGGVNISVSEKCTKSLEVAEKCTVSIGKFRSQFVAGEAGIIECKSQGGKPPPYLEAKIAVKNNVRSLEAIEKESLGDASRLFQFVPQVSDRTTAETFIVCEAIQKLEDEVIFHQSRKQQITIVYPPQPCPKISVVTSTNESVDVELVIEAFPLPELASVIWYIEDTNISQSLQVTQDSIHEFYYLNITSDYISKLNVTVSIKQVRPEDFGWVHYLVVRNAIGTQDYSIEFVPFRNDFSENVNYFGYIITSVFIITIFLGLIIISLIINAWLGRKWCWREWQSEAADSELKVPLNTFDVQDCPGYNPSIKSHSEMTAITVSKERPTRREVKHNHCQTPSPIMRSKKGHERADSQQAKYSSKASLKKSYENVSSIKENLTVRESTYPVF